jgi:hypothetical protein
VASDVRKKNHTKYLTGISSNAVFIRILINTPTKVKNFHGSEGVKQRKIRFSNKLKRHMTPFILI